MMKEKKYKRNLYWVGTRLSDIFGIEHVFHGAITLFGEKIVTSNFYCNPLCNQLGLRINHNNFEDNRISQFYAHETEYILTRDHNAFFLWYSCHPTHNCSEYVKKRTIYYNQSVTSKLFSNKLDCRMWLANYVKVLGTTTLHCNKNLYVNLCSLFPKDDSFVVQALTKAAGGCGTYILNKENHKYLINKLNNEKYLVSPYLKDAISTNQHIVLYENETVLFPCSIQLLLHRNDKILYRGCDYSSFEDLSSNVQDTINKYSMLIGDLARALGYRGVMGIDYIVNQENEVLFVEINPRFQGSTFTLNHILQQHHLPSIQEYHIEAFEMSRPSIYPANIHNKSYSSVAYHLSDYDNDISLKYRFETYVQQPEIKLISEGEIPKKGQIEQDALLFRILVNSNVSSITPNGIVLHPNIVQDKLSPFIWKQHYDEMLHLKIALLTHGIRVELNNREIDERLKRAVNRGFDLIFDGKWYVNACTEAKYISLTPFVIKWDQGNNFRLYYNDQYITNVAIDYIDKLSHLQTRNRISYYSIAQFLTDRLRIHAFPTCDYGYKLHKACRFCEEGNGLIPMVDYDIEDIYEVITAYIKSDLPIDHFLIGGGTSLDNHSWDRIIELVRYIRQYTKRNIYVMTIPPSKDVIRKLYKAGASELGFNIELYNRIYASAYMPAKGVISLNTYFDAFDEAVRLWGRQGAVRSLMIIGLEPIKDTLAGIEALCAHGVMPILSIFRPIYRTPLENVVPPNYNMILYIWKSAIQICKKYGILPGPACVPCQNNTLSLPFELIS